MKLKHKDFLAQRWVKDEIRRRVNYNPQIGSLTWATRPWCKHFQESSVGKSCEYRWVSTRYRQSTIKFEIQGRRIAVVSARVAWLCYYGDWPEHTIDHIDRDPWNNKIENLRDVTQKVNNSNKGFYKGNVFHHLIFHNGFWKVRFHGKIVFQSRCVGEALKARNKWMLDTQDRIT